MPSGRFLASIASTTHCAPKTCASSSISARARDRRGVDRDLVGARVEHGVGVGDLAHAAADRERHEHVVRGPARQLDHGRALVGGRRDVEEDELVGALGVVVRGELDRVAGVADVDELRALDDAAVVDVHAGDDALVVQRSVVRRAEEGVVDHVQAGLVRVAALLRRPRRTSSRPRCGRPRSVSLIVPAGSTS